MIELTIPTQIPWKILPIINKIKFWANTNNVAKNIVILVITKHYLRVKLFKKYELTKAPTQALIGMHPVNKPRPNDLYKWMPNMIIT